MIQINAAAKDPRTHCAARNQKRLPTPDLEEIRTVRPSPLKKLNSSLALLIFSKLFLSVPSRVRSRLLSSSGATSAARGDATSSQTSAHQTGDGSNAYSSNAYGASPRYPLTGGFANTGQSYNGQSHYKPHDESRSAAVPVGASTFPYATAGIYGGPSQNQYSSQPLPGMSTQYLGGTGYQQSAGYSQAHQRNPYVAYRGAYGGGYSTGNPYGYGNAYGGAMHQMSYPYAYGQVPQRMGYYRNSGEFL